MMPPGEGIKINGREVRMIKQDISQFTNIMEGLLEDFITLITDPNGIILYVHDNYAAILGVTPEEAQGKFCCDIIPNSRMHIVAKSEKSELGVAFLMKNGEYAVVNRLPIKKNGNLVGVICFVLFSTIMMTTAQSVKIINHLRDEISQYEPELSGFLKAKYSIDQIIGDAPNMRTIKESVYKISQTRSTVLISGETGTGKELFAHAIHQISPRCQHPLVRVNCAAIPAELFEAELFGYEAGAFTGARKQGKVGKFELANKGTLVLDEIHQMPMTMQPKLLRVLQEKEIVRVGGNKPINVDVRLIFITNKDLFDLVDKGEFREDLFYRINIVPIEVPPLRERLEDLPELTEALINKINYNLGLKISGIDQNVLDLFRLHDWPGNVRELEHTLERAANIVLSGPLTLGCFKNLTARLQTLSQKDTSTPLVSARRNVERERILEALLETEGNVLAASKLLKISRSVLYEKIKRYNIKVSRTPTS
ncbi:MAG: sigma 54-interacting transcriptional regulator [Negativicutes bacterium]|nr:sigma 54-interacting transcriptional regulator [Negativicutes bacterium]